MWVTIVLGILLGVAVLAALPFALSWLLMRWFGKISGLNRLEERYAATAGPAGPVYRKQRIGVGRVYYRKNGEVGIGENGLYLWVRPFLGRYTPLLIPWKELHTPQPTLLRMMKAVTLSVGRPEIATLTFLSDFYGKINPHLTRSDPA